MSHSLVPVGAVGLEMATLSWPQHMAGETSPSPFAAIFFPDSKLYSFTVGLTERVFLSSGGQAWVRAHDRPATFFTTAESL